MSNKSYTKEEFIKDLISSLGGKIFQVSFKTKSGSDRVKAVRAGVSKGVVGGLNTVAHKPEYVKLYVMNDRVYNNINVNNINKIVCGDLEYSFSWLRF